MATKINNRIVVMDDSTALVKLIRQILEKNGFEVEDAPNGIIGLQKVESFRPGLALVDIMMPEMDGFEATRRIHENFPDVKVVIFSAQPPQAVEKKALAAGAELFLQKPLREPVLLGIAKKYTTTEVDDSQLVEENILPFEPDQPYMVHIKCCYICGYDHVNVFMPRREAFTESWHTGLFPAYTAQPGFHRWDFLRNVISVCPSCLFASRDPNDFAVNYNHSSFPYKPDAKRILSRNISTRKRMIDSVTDLDMAFSNPNRNLRLTMDSFLLAEKSGNGLVMGDKEGVYTDIGYYTLMHAILRYTQTMDKIDFHSRLRDALNLFLNQLKLPGMRRATRAQTYYFIIALHMALGESIKANEMKQQLEGFYQGLRYEDAGEDERIWNERLLHIWKNGVDGDATRILEI
jgi:CheY-like chemotaxis protein